MGKEKKMGLERDEVRVLLEGEFRNNLERVLKEAFDAPSEDEDRTYPIDRVGYGLDALIGYLQITKNLYDGPQDIKNYRDYRPLESALAFTASLLDMSLAESSEDSGCVPRAGVEAALAEIRGLHNSLRYGIEGPNIEDTGHKGGTENS